MNMTPSSPLTPELSSESDMEQPGAESSPFSSATLGALRTLGARLKTLLEQSASWETWCACAPLVPDVRAQASPQPLEKRMLQLLGHLQQVFEQPRVQLQRVEERVGVARAHRLHARAYETLAAHPEDWLKRTLRGVAPKRVLAMLNEEDLNIYENRVAVRLCDHLEQYLSQRLRQLEALENLMEQATDTQQRLDSHWGVMHRASQLLGDLFTDHQGLKALKHTRELLQALHLELSGLTAHRLYRVIPRHAGAPVALQPTNILTNDQHYQHVATLWRAWVRFGRVLKSPERLVQDAVDWQLFCLLLVLRALQALKFEPETSTVAMTRLSSIDVKGPLGRVRLHIGSLQTGDGPLRLELVRVSGPPLLPLELFALTGPPEGRQPSIAWQRVLEPLKTERRRSASQVYPCEPVARCQSVGVSPLELYGVERVMGVLQSWILTQRYEAFEPGIWEPLPLPAAEARVAATSALGVMLASGNGNARGNGNERSRTGATPAKSKRPREQNRQEEAHSRQSLEPQRAQQEAERSLEQQVLRLCPVCSDEEKPSLRDNTFVLTCKSCSSHRELRRCSHCHRRFAVLKRKGSAWEQLEEERLYQQPSKDWLAIPTRTGWQCYHCHKEG